jgi:hypothetical protein
MIFGTAALVSPDLIVTAAHNIFYRYSKEEVFHSLEDFDQEQGYYYKDFIFYPSSYANK